MKRNVYSLGEICNNIKHTNIRVTGVERKKRKRKALRNVLKKLYLKISPKWEKKQSIKSKESPIQDKSKEQHVEIHTNQANRD